MDKKNKPVKEFDTVKFVREVRDKNARETKGMTFAEIKERINSRKLRHA